MIFEPNYPEHHIYIQNQFENFYYLMFQKNHSICNLLINYYKMLNFKVKYEEDLEEQIQNKSVMMYGDVMSLMDSCMKNESKVSAELKKIIEEI